MIDMATIQNAAHEAAAQYPVKRIELFGSYANGTALEGSDIDFLVEFTESPISLLEICGLQETLSSLLKADVDIVKLPLPKSNGLVIDQKVCVYEA